MPARDAAAAVLRTSPPLMVEVIPSTLPPGAVTTGTDRRTKRGRVLDGKVPR